MLCYLNLWKICLYQVINCIIDGNFILYFALFFQLMNLDCVFKRVILDLNLPSDLGFRNEYLILNRGRWRHRAGCGTCGGWSICLHQLGVLKDLQITFLESWIFYGNFLILVLKVCSFQNGLLLEVHSSKRYLK